MKNEEKFCPIVQRISSQWARFERMQRYEHRSFIGSARAYTPFALVMKLNEIHEQLHALVVKHEDEDRRRLKMSLILEAAQLFYSARIYHYYIAYDQTADRFIKGQSHTLPQMTDIHDQMQQKEEHCNNE